MILEPTLTGSAGTHLLGGVSTLLQLWCAGDEDHRWEEQFAKIVTIPCLLPVGSQIFPIDKASDGVKDGFEWLDFRVKRYLWFEGESFVRCDLEERCDCQPCSLEEFERDIGKRGWSRRDTYGEPPNS